MNTFILDFENYNISEEEISSIQEANEHLLQKRNLYALHELFTAFYINILRRIEFFGLNEVLSDINKKDLYEATSDSIIKRWEKFDEIDIIKSLRHLKILNNQTYSLFLSFYKSRKKILLDDNISEEYLFSFFNLLKVELFAHKFIKYNKKNKTHDRRKNIVIPEYRRKEDKKEEKIITPVHLNIKEKLSAKELYNIKDKKDDDDNEIEAIYI